MQLQSSPMKELYGREFTPEQEELLKTQAIAEIYLIISRNSASGGVREVDLEQLLGTGANRFLQPRLKQMRQAGLIERVCYSWYLPEDINYEWRIKTGDFVEFNSGSAEIIAIKGDKAELFVSVGCSVWRDLSSLKLAEKVEDQYGIWWVVGRLNNDIPIWKNPKLEVIEQADEKYVVLEQLGTESLVVREGVRPIRNSDETWRIGCVQPLLIKQTEAPEDSDCEWLTSCSWGDINCQNTLKRASIATLEKALEYAEARPAGNKLRIRGLRQQLRRVKVAQTKPSPEPSITSDATGSTVQASEEKFTNCWRTPNTPDQPILDKAEEVFGGQIGLDPTADKEHSVPALHHFTREDDCLSQSWEGLGAVFMNPPFDQPHLYLDKLAQEFKLGHIPEAIALLKVGCVNNAKTGAIIQQYASVVAPWKAPRIKFIDPVTGQPSAGSADFDCVLIYFGANWQKFLKVFRPYVWNESVLALARTSNTTVEKWLDPRGIIIDAGTQSRTKTDLETRDRYAELMAEGLWEWERKPLPVVFCDGKGDIWAGDCHHRTSAAVLADVEWMLYDVRPGTKIDAILYSCSANAAHGLPLTPKDQRRRVELLLDTIEVLSPEQSLQKIKEIPDLSAKELERAEQRFETSIGLPDAERSLAVWSSYIIAKHLGLTQSQARTVQNILTEREMSAKISRSGLDVGDRVEIVEATIYHPAGTTGRIDQINPKKGIFFIPDKGGMESAWLFPHLLRLTSEISHSEPQQDAAPQEQTLEADNTNAELNEQQKNLIGRGWNGSQVLPSTVRPTAPAEVDDRPGAYSRTTIAVEIAQGIKHLTPDELKWVFESTELSPEHYAKLREVLVDRIS